MITRATLDKHCQGSLIKLTNEQAFDACVALGPFSRWWLSAAVRRKACRYDPCYPEWTRDDCAVPGESGACTLVMVRTAALSFLRKAFLFPLIWQQGRPHCGLPRALTEMANQILDQFPGDGKKPDKGWGLAPNPGGWSEKFSLSDDLGLTFRSGWASMAAGLILARLGLSSTADVFASACWDSKRFLRGVGHLAAKVRMAARSGSVVFVAPWQVEEAKQVSGGRVDVCPLNVSADPRRILEPLLTSLGAPPRVCSTTPDAIEQFHLGVKYYKLLPHRDPLQRNYYFNELLPIIRDRVRESAERSCGNSKPKALVVVVSDGWELIPILAYAFGVEKILLLHTKDYERHLSAVEAQLNGVVVLKDKDSHRLGLFSLATLRENMTGHLQKLVEELGSADIVTDVTLGSKLMSLTLEQVVRKHYPASRLVYVGHRTPDGRPEPGSEYPLIWRASDTIPTLPDQPKGELK